VAFDPTFARDVALPLAQAAYTVMGGNTATLPAGYSQTSLIKADAVMLTAMTSPHPAVTAMTNNTNIFGLMGHNPVSRTAFVSFRGTSDPAEWVADIDAIPDDYRPISGFGQAVEACAFCSSAAATLSMLAGSAGAVGVPARPWRFISQ